MRLPQTANLSLNVTKTHVFSLSLGTLFLTSARDYTILIKKSPWLNGLKRSSVTCISGVQSILEV
jgi:hypothetical protein